MSNLAFSNNLNYTPLDAQYVFYDVIGEKYLISKKNATTYLLILFIFLTTFVSFRLMNSFKQNPNQQVLTAATQVLPSVTPTPTPSIKPSPFLRKLIRPTPTLTVTPAPTNTPGPTQTPTPTPEPPDTTPPVITSMGGPEDGTTIHSRDFCFPMTITDDRSVAPKIWTQYRFDSETWSDWSNDTAESHNAYSPCFHNVSDGEHIFAVHAKDGVGNVSDTIKRDFKVEVIPPPLPSPRSSNK